jgi:hypothetical protein
MAACPTGKCGQAAAVVTARAKEALKAPLSFLAGLATSGRSTVSGLKLSNCGAGCQGSQPLPRVFDLKTTDGKPAGYAVVMPNEDLHVPVGYLFAGDRYDPAFTKTELVLNGNS